jgi:L-malate glycosyltransferase
MNLLLLSDANSIHTQKWVFALSKRGFNLRLFSLFKPNNPAYKLYNNLGVKIDSTDLRQKIWNPRNPNISKILYISTLPKLKKIVKEFSPDIIHAHYASSYGILSYLLQFKPTIISVWGSDIYDFPKRNFLNKWLLMKVINYADSICSTSNAMREIIINDYKRDKCYLTPFGVDIDKFIPSEINQEIFTVGTIKSIESHNGIDVIIDAAKILVHDMNLSDIQFLIVGKGNLLEKMKEKCKKYSLDKNITFTGHILHKEIVKYFQKLSIFIAVSTQESFGVSILEAASCGIPAITSNVGGLPEVNKNLKTGYIIEANNEKMLSEKIIKLYYNDKLRKEMGKKARKTVIEKFDWNQNLEKMITIYSKYNK